MKIECPNCGEDLSVSLEAELPEQTDLTLSLDITPGQLVMASTVAGVLENFAEMQVAIGEAMGAKTQVFVAGLSYENDRIAITTRICNSPAQGIEAATADTTGTGVAEGESPVAKPCAQGQAQ